MLAEFRHTHTTCGAAVCESSVPVTRQQMGSTQIDCLSAIRSPLAPRVKGWSLELAGARPLAHLPQPQARSRQERRCFEGPHGALTITRVEKRMSPMPAFELSRAIFQGDAVELSKSSELLMR